MNCQHPCIPGLDHIVMFSWLADWYWLYYCIGNINFLVSLLMLCTSTGCCMCKGDTEERWSYNTVL